MDNNKEEFVDAKQELDAYQDIISDQDDTASFVSAIDDTVNQEQDDMEKEEIPQDITLEELYVLRSALSETYRIKKIEAIEKAKKTLDNRFKARLISHEVDKLLDEYIALKKAKKEAELKGDVNLQIDITSQIGNLESKMILSFEEKDIRKLCQDNIKEYEDKYDRMWDMWLERYDKVKYASSKKLIDLTRIKKFIDDNGLSLPQKRNRKNDKMDAVIEEYFPIRTLSQRKTVLQRLLSRLLYISIKIKNGIVGALKRLFSIDKQMKAINKEIRNTEKMISKSKGNKDDLLARKNELLKLKYKYKIFKSEVRYAPYLREGFEESIRLSLDTIKQTATSMESAKRSLKLRQEKGDISDTKDEILKTNKLLPKINSIDMEKKYNEEISKPK